MKLSALENKMKIGARAALFGVLGLAFVVLVRPVNADPPPTPPPALSETETWVVAQINADLEANLDREFPGDEARRTLHARFLEDLLTGALPVTKSRRWGVRITGAVFSEMVNMSSDVVVCKMQLQRCHFKRWANFYRTEFSDDVSLYGSEFLADVNFYGAKVGGNLYLNEATVAGQAEFSAAEITGECFAGGTYFLNKEQSANFLGVKFDANVSFDNATFAGPVSFANAVIGDSWSSNHAHFANKDQPANFLYMKVHSNAFFSQSVFRAGAMFMGMDVGGILSVDGGQFLHQEKPANFINVKVGGNLTLNGALFAGPSEFVSAQVKQFLVVNGAHFQNPAQVARFLGIKVGETAFIAGTTFAGPANFAESSFFSLTMTEPQLGDVPMPALDLSGSVVQHELILGHLHLGDLVATSLRVQGPAAFDDLRVDHGADLGYADFANLDLTGSQWPPPGSGSFVLRGMNYKYINAAKTEAESHERLLQLTDQASYAADVYGNLEAFFVRQGYSDDANRTYVAGRCRERRETMSWHSFGFYWSWVLQGIGYGRYPERALFVCVLVVTLGCILFKPSKMEPQKSEDGERQKYYSRFWYSLELFLPIVELKAVDAWEPKSEHRFLRHYMRIHTLLGWILIPIGLASVTGVIK